MAIRGLILDLNGTLYFKERVIEGAAGALMQLRDAGYKLRFMTNTDSKTRAQLHELICSYGLDLPIQEIFSPAQATFDYLKKNHFSYTGLLPEALEDEFSPLKRDDTNPDCVIIGENRTAINYQTLDTLFRHLMKGAELIVMQPGRHYFLADGAHLDTGALAAMFEYATGHQGQVMAKPSSHFFTMMLSDMRLKGSEVVVVGDDVETDMMGASKIGAKSILVRTGKYQSADEFLTPIKPSSVIDSIADLPKALTLF
ncbi:MAG: HAD hydrolase-like protein [Trueperaceae bacterium]|nr:HAD hydrolase-like protein [Trueperaceae bacterium]